jgi:tripartite-type tricarboxylate transporter receptor subunit TctC
MFFERDNAHLVSRAALALAGGMVGQAQRRCQEALMKQLAFAVAAAALATMLMPAGARAQEPFPSRPVQVIVPATAGGPVDTGVRMIEPALSSALGQPVVLLNHPGASGTLGMHDVATAAPDGYTIGQGVNSIFTITRISGTSVPFTLDDFSLLGNYATDVSVLAVSADAPWQTLDDIIAYVHSNPGKLNYASAGVGTVSSLSMQALAHYFKLNMVAVPFQGGAQLTTAILGRQVDIGMVPYTTGAAMFESKKLRALVTTAAQRLPKLPDIPTLAEKGITANGLNLIMGLYAPHGLQDDVRSTLVAAVAKAAKDSSFIAKIEAIGLFGQYEDPAKARSRLETEYTDIVALNRQLQN